jgi:hypothetical protein
MATRRLLVALSSAALFAALASLISTSTALAQSPDNALIIGGWRISEGPGTPPEGFVTVVFNQGGTMTALAGDGDRSQGVWIRTAPRTFAFTLDEFDIQDDGTLHRNRIRGTVVLPRGDRNSAAGTLTFDEMSPDGTTVVFPGPTGIPVQATRMLVVPE